MTMTMPTRAQVMRCVALAMLCVLLSSGAPQAQSAQRGVPPLAPPSNRACLDACSSACRAEAERCLARDPRTAGACAAEANLCRLRCSADCR